MKHLAQFEFPKEYKVILRDSYRENTYYGLDDFDCRYLKIVQSKFGCLNSFHTIPDRVRMEMAPFKWSDKKNKFVLDENNRQAIQLNQLEHLIVSHSVVYS
jgi:hypothetical protein